METWLIITLSIILSLILISSTIALLILIIRKKSQKSKKTIFPKNREEIETFSLEINRRSIKDEIILITGGTGGIGEHLWQEFYSEGAKVIITGRSKEKAKKSLENLILTKSTKMNKSLLDPQISDLKSGKWENDDIFESKNFLFYRLDQKNLKDCKEFSNWFIKKFQKLDIFILNSKTKKEILEKTEQKYEYMIGINHFSHVYLINQLFPLIKKTPNSRIISKSCYSAKKPEKLKNMVFFKNGNYDPKIDLNLFDKIAFQHKEEDFEKFRAYFQSKFAKTLFIKGLARFLEDERIFSKAASYYYPIEFEDNYLKESKEENLEKMKNALKTNFYLCYVDYSELGNGDLYCDCKIDKEVHHDLENKDYWRMFWNLTLRILKRKKFSCGNFRKYNT